MENFSDGFHCTLFTWREHTHQSSPWVKPREWPDFELIWHLASYFATTSHTFSESKAKFVFNFCNRERSCWQESCLGWRQGPDSWASSQPPPTFLTCEVLTELQPPALHCPVHTNNSGFPIWAALEAVDASGEHLELEHSGRLWSCPKTLESLIFLHTQHPWKCLLFLLPSRPKAPWQKAEKKTWQVVGELIHFLCQFSPFSSQHNYQTSILWQLLEKEHFICCDLSQ